jgi:hypothetical protein
MPQRHMGDGDVAPPFLTLALDGCEWLASCPSCFSSWERAPSTHWTGGWEGSRVGMDALEKRKTSRPCWELNPCHLAHRLSLPACQSVLQPWASLGLLYNQSPPGVRFLNKIIFYRMGLLAPCPTPILEDQGFSLSLYPTRWPYQHGWPCW